MTFPRSDIAPKPNTSLFSSRPALLARLDCPFEARMNPYQRAGAAQANAWLVQTFGDTRGSRRLRAAHMEQLISGFYPNAEREQLTFANKFLLWAFSVDDLVDESDVGRGTAGLARLFTKLLAVMNGDAPGTTPLEVGLRHLMDSLQSFADEAQYRAFRRAVQAYFGAMLWEANNRACGWTPDEFSYQMLRPAAGAVPPFWQLIEPINNVVLKKEHQRDPGLVQLSTLAGRIVCWHNDLLSHEKERSAGDVHNLTIVFERSRGLSPQEAIEQAVEFANQEVAEFVTLAKSVRERFSDSFRDEDGSIDEYVGTLESMMATTLSFTYSSQRYEGSAQAADVDIRSA